MSDKPKFNPNVSFTPVEAAQKPAFDPNAPALPATPGPRDISQTEAILRGGAQGLSQLWADEGAGVLHSGHGLLTGNLPETLGSYRQGRDEYRAQDEAARAQHPKSFIGSEIATGTLPLMALKGISPLAALILGAVQGAGGSKADLTKGEFGGVATDALLGGALAGGATKGLQKLLGGAAKKSIPEIQKVIESFENQRVKLSPREKQFVAALKGQLNSAGNQVVSGSNEVANKLSPFLSDMKDAVKHGGHLAVGALGGHALGGHSLEGLIAAGLMKPVIQHGGKAILNASKPAIQALSNEPARQGLSKLAIGAAPTARRGLKGLINAE